MLRYAGDEEVPAWVAVRTVGFKYVENADGTVELYDLIGSLAPPDPHELRNHAGQRRFEPIEAHLRGLLASLVASQAEG